MKWKTYARVVTRWISRQERVCRILRATGGVPYRAWRTMPVNAWFRVEVAPRQTFMYRSVPDDFIGMALFWSGLRHWEAETFPIFRAFAETARGFVDIGASTGTYSLVTACVNSEAEIVAFEPVKRVFGRLQEHVDANDLRDRVRTVNAAVAAESGEKRFFVPSGDVPTGGFLEGAQEVGQAGEWTTVRTCGLKESIGENFPLDLVKIDVEGAEGVVIEAMAEVIAVKRPTLFIEFLNNGTYDLACDTLDKLGYKYFWLTRTGLVSIERPAPKADSEERNYLCIPKERALPSELLMGV